MWLEPRRSTRALILPLLQPLLQNFRFIYFEGRFEKSGCREIAAMADRPVSRSLWASGNDCVVV